MVKSSASFVNTTQLLPLIDGEGRTSTGWSSNVVTQRLNTQVLRSSTTVFAINDREETTASAMASVKTYVLVTLVVFVQLVEPTLGGCVFGQYVFRFLFQICVNVIVVYVDVAVVIVCDFYATCNAKYLLMSLLSEV